MSNPLEDMEKPDVIFCIGTNMTECHPVAATRLKKALARGAMDKSDVTGFYRSALPELGWNKLSDGEAGSTWQRGGEKLSVDIDDTGNPLVVRFSLSPN